MEGTGGCRGRDTARSARLLQYQLWTEQSRDHLQQEGKAPPGSALPASPAQRPTKEHLGGLWFRPPRQHLQQTWPAKGFLFLPCPPPGMPWRLELHPSSSPMAHGHSGKCGRAQHVILALLNPGLMSLLLLVTVRVSGGIYWSAANLQRASSKPQDTGSHFPKIFQISKSESSPSTIYSHKLCGFL